MSLDAVNPGAERVVLGKKAPWSMVGFQWTGLEPDSLSDLDAAMDCGAIWEGDELVTYNLSALEHNWAHRIDGYLEDSD